MHTHTHTLKQELLKTKKKLKEAQVANTEFLAKMSHELRTPMSVILANVQMVVQGFFGEISNTQKEKLSDVLEHTQELLNLINDILDFSTLAKKTITLNPSHFNLSKLLRKIIEEFEIFFRNKPIELRSEIAQEIYIHADPHRIKQIINNLLTNAIKFTNQGSIILGARQTEDRVLIHVKDTGIGIEEQYHARIFKDFFQVPSHKRGGVGLGLSISKSFVDMHGGKLTVQSKALEGSEFLIELPYTQGCFG